MTACYDRSVQYSSKVSDRADDFAEFPATASAEGAKAIMWPLVRPCYDHVTVVEGGDRRHTNISQCGARKQSRTTLKMEGGSGGRNVHISCLFPEILAIIFSYLDIRDKGRAAQVCSVWKDAAYNRMVWRRVEAKLHLRRSNPSLFPSLVRRGIRRVQVLSIKRSLRDVVHGIDKLEFLNLSGCYNVTDNSLRHAIAQDMPNLRELNLSLCKQISDGALQTVSPYLPNLEVLELAGCSNVTSNGLLICSLSLQKLKMLNLKSCRAITDAGIGHLAGATGPGMSAKWPGHAGPQGTPLLEALVLQDCQKLSDQALKYISSGLCRLSSINLSFCASVTDSGLRFFAKMPCLRELNLRSCDNVSDIGIGFLAEGGSRITALDVSFCERISDQALLHISLGLFHLRSISLSACNISDDGLCRMVRTSHELCTLNIGQCSRVTDMGLAAISDHCKQLNSIDLYGCTNITTVGLEKIMGLPSLSTLNLGLWHRR